MLPLWLLYHSLCDQGAARGEADEGTSGQSTPALCSPELELQRTSDYGTCNETKQRYG